MIDRLALDSLSPDRRDAIEALRAGYRFALGEDLHALYVHGAMTLPEAEGVVDMDYHALLTGRPDTSRKAAINEVAEGLARDHAPWGADLDGWLILLEEAWQSTAPEHRRPIC